MYKTAASPSVRVASAPLAKVILFGTDADQIIVAAFYPTLIPDSFKDIVPDVKSYQL